MKMSTAVKERSKESRVVTKSLEIKKATHQEIIDIGDQLFREEKRKLCKEFFISLSKQEEILYKKLEIEKQNALEELIQKHQNENEQLKVFFTELQNKALKEEASRVKDIMNKVAETLVKETVLEGQKKLDEALLDARTQFDIEKKDIIQCTIQEQQKLAGETLAGERYKHEKQIQHINQDWMQKMKLNTERNSHEMKELLKKKEEELERFYKEKLQNSIVEVELEHKIEMMNREDDIEVVEKQNRELAVTVEHMTGTLEEMKMNTRKVLTAFRQFIESTDGFCEGQSDFVLERLVPPKLSEFIYNSHTSLSSEHES